MKFSSTIYTVREGLDPNVIITVLANGSVDESSFSVRVIAKDALLQVGTYIHSVRIHNCEGSARMWTH